MEVLDIIMLIFMGIMLIVGFRKGLIISLASLVALILGIYLAVYFSEFAAGLIRNYFDVSSTYLPWIAFAVTFLVVLIGVLLLGKLFEKMVSMVGMGFLNHLAGAVFGLAKSVLLLSIIFLIIQYADPEEHLITPKAKEHAILYKPVASVVPTLIRWVGAEGFLEGT